MAIFLSVNLEITLSKNTRRRFFIVLALGYGQRLDHNVALSAHAVHELLERRFPSHGYSLFSTIRLLHQYQRLGLVRTPQIRGLKVFQLTDPAFRDARHFVAIRDYLGHQEPTSEFVFHSSEGEPLPKGLATTSALVKANLLLMTGTVARN